MHFPDFLYLLSNRDQQVTWIDPVLQQFSGSGAAAAVAVNYQVPAGRALMLCVAHLNADPGLAQNIVSMEIRVLTPNGSGAGILQRSDEALAANALGNLNFDAGLLVPPQWFINAEAAFNAGVAANALTLGISGILIPAGNIQR